MVVMFELLKFDVIVQILNPKGNFYSVSALTQLL